jgi:two-component system sensor histidine kinase YesM
MPDRVYTEGQQSDGELCVKKYDDTLIERVPFKSLSVNVFLLILLFLLLPVYLGFIIMKTSYENYLRQELSNQIITNIKKGEEDFSQTFQRMVNISNMFVSDRELISLLRNDGASYWDRNKRFDEIVNTLLTNNLFDLSGVKITMFDRQNRNYANWSLNWNDYSFLMSQEWANRSIIDRGIISWNFFVPSFVEQERERYIFLARSILYPVSTGDRMASLVIGINQRVISSILTKNDMGADFIRVCTGDTLEDVFAIDGINLVQEKELLPLLEEAGEKKSGSLLCDLSGVRYLLSYYTLTTPWSFNGQPLMVLYFTNYQRITDNLSAYSRNINYGMFLFLIILIVIMIVIAYTIARPIRVLDKNVKHYAQTREIRALRINRKDEIGSLSRTFFDMEIKINDLFDKLRQENEIREQYRFQALRAQINPHFLFNSLNTIRWMALIRKADNIAETIDALVKILEYSIKGEREFVTLGEELDMIHRYIAIQNSRYGEDLAVYIEIDRELEEYRIIKFILQPVVENAFLHAFKNLRRKKTIRISGREDGGRLKLLVEDNGNGMPPEYISAPNDGSLRGNRKKVTGIGLVNVHERIKIEYGEDFGLRLESRSGEGTRVEYTLPLLKWGTDR